MAKKKKKKIYAQSCTVLHSLCCQDFMTTFGTSAEKYALLKWHLWISAADWKKANSRVFVLDTRAHTNTHKGTDFCASLLWVTPQRHRSVPVIRENLRVLLQSGYSLTEEQLESNQKRIEKGESRISTNANISVFNYRKMLHLNRQTVEVWVEQCQAKNIVFVEMRVCVFVMWSWFRVGLNVERLSPMAPWPRFDQRGEVLSVLSRMHRPFSEKQIWFWLNYSFLSIT